MSGRVVLWMRGAALAATAAAIFAGISVANAIRIDELPGPADATALGDVQSLARTFGAPLPVVSQRFRDGDVRAASGSIATARSLLGYEPQVALEQGLATLAGAPETKVMPR